jgi:hypothetical protein
MSRESRENNLFTPPNIVLNMISQKYLFMIEKTFSNWFYQVFDPIMPIFYISGLELYAISEWDGLLP